MKESGIYCIENIANGKKYIGSSTNIKRRIIGHFYQLRKGIHPSPHLNNAFRQYGENGFRIKILILCENADLFKYEQFFLNHFVTANPLFGYNICPASGSRLGLPHPPETKRYMSELLRLRYQDKTAREKMSDSMRKRYVNSENRIKTGEATRKAFESGELRNKLSNINKIRSGLPKERKRLSEMARKAWLNPEIRERIMNSRKKTRDIKGYSDKELKRRSEDAKKLWLTPEWRKLVSEKISQAAKKRFAFPEERIKISQRQKQRYQDPLEKEKMSIAGKRYYANKNCYCESFNAV